MDTPDKSKNDETATFQGEFVDSPVFDFPNTISPMKPACSSYHTGVMDLEIDWDDSMKFYESGEHAMHNMLPYGGMFSDSVYLDSGFMENEETSTEHAMHNMLPLPFGGMLSDSGDKEINPSSSKKKKLKLEQAEEAEVYCKRCKCKKSECLMLYCGCFAAGIYCMGPCACINCFNRHIHIDIVLAARKHIESGNPLAFSPNVISLSETGDDFRTIHRNKRGCSCKKSKCAMLYCGCYRGGVGCSSYCKCEDCKNAFGRKEDGSRVLNMDHQLEEGETNSHVVDSALTATASGSGRNLPINFPAEGCNGLKVYASSSSQDDTCHLNNALEAANSSGLVPLINTFISGTSSPTTGFLSGAPAATSSTPCVFNNPSLSGSVIQPTIQMKEEDNMQAEDNILLTSPQQMTSSFGIYDASELNPYMFGGQKKH